MCVFEVCLNAENVKENLESGNTVVLTSLIYIYIYMCVCVCVLARERVLVMMNDAYSFFWIGFLPRGEKHSSARL